MNVKPGDFTKVVESNVPESNGALVHVEAFADRSEKAGVFWLCTVLSAVLGYRDSSFESPRKRFYPREQARIADRCLRRIDPPEDDSDIETKGYEPASIPLLQPPCEVP